MSKYSTNSGAYPDNPITFSLKKHTMMKLAEAKKLIEEEKKKSSMLYRIRKDTHELFTMM